VAILTHKPNDPLQKFKVGTDLMTIDSMTIDY
jgi:hypothetical protein